MWCQFWDIIGVRENLPKGTAPEDPAVKRKKLSRNTIAKIRLGRRNVRQLECRQEIRTRAMQSQLGKHSSFDWFRQERHMHDLRYILQCCMEG